MTIDRMDDNRINILGTTYTTHVVSTKDIDNHAGMCEFYKKKISICNDFDDIEDKQRVIRHEILHAFFHESGLNEYADNETLVDFIATQFPKLHKLYEDLEVL